MIDVSVIIPTYNRAQSVTSAIESVLEQSLQPDEVIVVDDGSTDDTRSILTRFNDRIRVISQVNQGASSARNTGISAARGEFVAFLDSDDCWLPKKLELQMQGFLEHPDAVASATDLRLRICNEDSQNVFEMRGSTAGSLPKGYIEDAFYFALGGWFCTPTWIIRRKVLAEIGGFTTGLHIYEDLELICRVAARGGFYIVPEVLVTTGWGLGATNLRALAGEDTSRTRQLLLDMYERLMKDTRCTRHQKSLVSKSRAGLALRMAADARFNGEARASSIATAAWRLHPTPINSLRMLAILLGNRSAMKAFGLR